jgi:hypothetical protein
MMASSNIFDDTDALATELLAVIAVPTYDNSPRIVTSDVACSLALEHWQSVRVLLREGLLPSAVVVHRAQFEATVRSIWLLYAASDACVEKLGAALSQESEQAAKNMPQTNVMMERLATKAPQQAFDALARFKENSWKALNSYAHAGIHPMRRHGEGYPAGLIGNILRNANGLGVVACMQAAILSGQQPLQAQLLSVAEGYPTCMPPRL